MPTPREVAAALGTAVTLRGVGADSLASVVGEERARDGLKRRAHDSSRAMDGEARFSLARTIRVHTPCGVGGLTPKSIPVHEHHPGNRRQQR